MIQYYRNIMLAHLCYANKKSLRWFRKSWHPRKNHFMTPLPKQNETSRFPSLEQNHQRLLNKNIRLHGSFPFQISPIVPYLPIVPHIFLDSKNEVKTSQRQLQMCRTRKTYTNFELDTIIMTTMSIDIFYVTYGATRRMANKMISAKSGP